MSPVIGSDRLAIWTRGLRRPTCKRPSVRRVDPRSGCTASHLSIIDVVIVTESHHAPLQNTWQSEQLRHSDREAMLTQRDAEGVCLGDGSLPESMQQIQS